MASVPSAASRVESDPHESSSEHLDGVLVVGGGYAGLRAARAVEQAGHRVTVLDQRTTHDFITRLAAVAAGTTEVDRAAEPLDAFQSQIRTGRVARVGDGSITLDDGRTFTADAVVVSAGARPTHPPIDGIEHALPLRTAADALAIRTALTSASSLVVVGGGATGVQLGASVAYEHPDIRVAIVDVGPRLLSPMSSATATGARRILESRGARIHVDALVERIAPTGVDIATSTTDDRGEATTDEHRHIEGLVVWAGGFEARADELGVDVSDDGRILVHDDLRVLGMSRTFAAGDIAAHLDRDGAELPMSAQIAVQAGTAAGENAARLLDGVQTEPASLAQRGWVLDLGGRRGLAEFGPVALTSPFADLLPPILHRLIDLKTLFGMGGISALRS